MTNQGIIPPPIRSLILLGAFFYVVLPVSSHELPELVGLQDMGFNVFNDLMRSGLYKEDTVKGVVISDPEAGIHQDEEDGVEYEDDLDEGDDDNDDSDFEDDEEEQQMDEQWTEEDDKNLAEARQGHIDMLTEMDPRSIIVPSGTYVIVPGDVYVIYSHPTFPVTKYPNLASQKWFFLTVDNNTAVVVHCPTNIIEWSRKPKCHKDKFAIFTQTTNYRRGVRRCGNLNGFWKKYETGIKIIFKSNSIIRKPGFCCTVKGTHIIPPCNDPVLMPSRPVVTECADIHWPGCPCQCRDLFDDAGNHVGICLFCEICRTCDTLVFANYDFTLLNEFRLFIHCVGILEVVFPDGFFGNTQAITHLSLCFESFSFPIGIFSPLPALSYYPCPQTIDTICPVGPTVSNTIMRSDGTCPLATTICPVINAPVTFSAIVSLQNGDINMTAVLNPEIVESLTLSECCYSDHETAFDLTMFTNLKELHITNCVRDLSQTGTKCINLNSAAIQQINIEFPCLTQTPTIHDICLDYGATQNVQPTVNIT